MKVLNLNFSPRTFFHLPQETGIFLVGLLLVALFTASSPEFLSWSTWGGILTAATEIGLLALGTTLLMTCGEYDLSVGSIFAFAGILFAMGNEKILVFATSATSATSATAATSAIYSLILFLSVVLFGGLLGFINGLITLKMKIPSFITTLGALLFWRGLVLLLSDGFPVTALDTSLVMKLLATELFPGTAIYSSLLIWPLLALIFYYLLHHHRLGNWVMSTGGQERAAYSMGIPTSKIKLLCFTLNGALAALAGIVQFCHLSSISPTAGEQYELRSIAIAVIGGTALTGGRGTIVGTIAGTLLLSLMSAGLVQAGVSTYWFRSFVGIILVVAVVINGRFLQWREAHM